MSRYLLRSIKSVIDINSRLIDSDAGFISMIHQLLLFADKYISVEVLLSTLEIWLLVIM